MSGRCSSWGRLRRARGGSPAGLELASAHGSTARVKGESGAESAARVRAAVLALGSGGARAGRRERRERASGEASTHLGPRRRSLAAPGSSPTRRRSTRIGHAKDSPEPGRGVLEASGARGARWPTRSSSRPAAAAASFSRHNPARAVHSGRTRGLVGLASCTSGRERQQTAAGSEQVVASCRGRPRSGSGTMGPLTRGGGSISA